MSKPEKTGPWIVKWDNGDGEPYFRAPWNGCSAHQKDAYRFDSKTKAIEHAADAGGKVYRLVPRRKPVDLEALANRIETRGYVLAKSEAYNDAARMVREASR